MRLGAGVQLAFVLVDSAKVRNRPAILRKIGTSVPPALPNDHENTSKASRAFTLCPPMSEMRLGAGVQLAHALVESAKDRNRPAILRKVTTLFGTLVPPALQNDHENTSIASKAFASCPHLSTMRLGAGVKIAFILVDSAKDRNRQRAILMKITTLFSTPVPPALPNDYENTSKASRVFTLCPNLSAMCLGAGVQVAFVLVDSAKDRNRPVI